MKKRKKKTLQAINVCYCFNDVHEMYTTMERRGRKADILLLNSSS